MDHPFRRRSIRLRDYDYTASGAYFITLCTKGRICLLGDVVSGEIRLNTLGAIVREEWMKTPTVRPGVLLDAFVIMPNHLHGVVLLPENATSTDKTGAHVCAPPSPIRAPLYRPPRSLSTLVSGLKAATTKRINEVRQTPRVPVWQRNYYEHVIRSESDLLGIRDYIEANPGKWFEDPENPSLHS